LSYDVLPKSFFLFVLFYTFYNLFFSQYNLLKLFQLKESSQKIEKSIDEYTLKNRKSEQLLELIEEHPEVYREKFAREYMQLQRPDEFILLLKE